MARTRGTNRDGKNFSKAEEDTVWAKGRTVPGWDSSKRRKDALGNEIWRTKYGDVSSSYGWEIDHIKPVSKGGSDTLSNLQPLQWEANRTKGDTSPWP